MNSLNGDNDLQQIANRSQAEVQLFKNFNKGLPCMFKKKANDTKTFFFFFRKSSKETKAAYRK